MIDPRVTIAVITLTAIIAAPSCYSQIVRQSHRVADITQPPPAVVEKCARTPRGCYVLTHAEMVAALQAARRAGQRSMEGKQ